ncbi:preprotein translocase subunit YajC [Clostridium sp.]|uniref:preprotein translocase subunit YajC n=1 Tax=Clostridium sp. TaxID=1506 RepID=UPI002618746A|nr:preprotein translocase subunit YajC [Clostridium sp.]
MPTIQVIFPFILMLGVMYLFLILPEKKRTKKYNEMLTSLQKNDEVITRGGVMGKIVIVEENHVVIETSAERTKLKISKTGIATKVNKIEE